MSKVGAKWGDANKDGGEKEDKSETKKDEEADDLARKGRK